MKNKITQLDRTIIRIMIQNDLNKIYYGKDIYSIYKEDENIYCYNINYNYRKFFRIEGNKIIIND